MTEQTHLLSITAPSLQQRSARPLSLLGTRGGSSDSFAGSKSTDSLLASSPALPRDAPPDRWLHQSAAYRRRRRRQSAHIVLLLCVLATLTALTDLALTHVVGVVSASRSAWGLWAAAAGPAARAAAHVAQTAALVAGGVLLTLTLAPFATGSGIPELRTVLSGASPSSPSPSCRRRRRRRALRVFLFDVPRSARPRRARFFLLFFSSLQASARAWHPF